MHILGKIFAWILVLAAGASTTLMARQLQIRNSYTKTLEDLKKDNEERAERIATKEKTLANLEADYASVMTGWNNHWDKRDGGQYKSQNPKNLPLVQVPSFSVGVGTNQSVGKIVDNPSVKVDTANAAATFKTQLQPIMHVFWQTDDPETSIYVGPFELPTDATRQDVTANGVRMLPQWALRPGEYASWDYGTKKNWRYRAAAPSAYPEQLLQYYLKIDDVEDKITVASANVVKRDAELETAKGEVTRYKVIISGPNGLGGILTDLDKEDDKRNALQADVDRLRRDIKQNLEKRTNLVESINQSAKTLPQPQPVSPKTTGK
jgi:hypothetical protein